MAIALPDDVRALLDFLRTNYARDLPEFREHVITALPQLVRSEVTGADVAANVVIYEAFVEGKLDAPKHLLYVRKILRSMKTAIWMGCWIRSTIVFDQQASTNGFRHASVAQTYCTTSTSDPGHGADLRVTLLAVDSR